MSQHQHSRPEIRTLGVFSRDLQYSAAFRTVLHFSNCAMSWAGTGRASVDMIGRGEVDQEGNQ